MINIIDKASKICIAWVSMNMFLLVDKKYKESQMQNVMLFQNDRFSLKQTAVICGFMYFAWKTINE